MGKWTFAPLPGTYRADNTFNNSGVTSGTAVVIMEQAKDKDSSWEFLKWWTSSETQYSYARELESILGAAARHNTANIEAFKLLPWSKAEREILLSQWGITVGVPEVAGGYYVGRNLENAIRAVINNDANPRETFSDYIVLINSEITRKRKEFGLPVD
jgi:ABC-type glycerol-3-phosphate transport system substrate-binding protein